MKLMMIYTVLGVMCGSAAGSLGAGPGLSLMASLIGPPLLHFGFLALRLNERF